MTNDQHSDVEVLLGAYALDAVDPDEAERIEAHLADCPRCRAEVDRHREVAAAIGNSVEPLPPHLWDRIAGQLERPPVNDTVPRLGGRADPAPAAGDPVAPVVPLAGSRSATTRSLGRRGVVATVLAVAAVVVIAFLAVGLVHANNQVNRLHSASGSLSAAVSSALADPSSQRVVMDSPTGQALATAVILPDGHAFLTDIRMPALPGDRTYQLWGMIGGQPISLSLLGHHPTAVAFSFGSAHPSALAVTDEPAGGVVAPTSVPVASAVVSA
jgi:anti-sigma factor RsiW